MPAPLRVLILEDRPADAELLVSELQRAGIDPDWRCVECESDFLAQLTWPPEVILADFHMPQFDAMRALDLLYERRLAIPLLLVTGSIGEELAVECIKRGAVDYLLKDRIARLGPAVRQALEQHHLRQEKQRLEQQHAELVNTIDGIVWEVDVQTFRFLFVSPQAERILGYPVSRWLDEPTFWWEHIHPEDRDWALSFCMAATREKRPHEFQYRMLAADGRVVWLHDFVTVAVEKDQPVRLRGVMMDVTPRALAEQALRDSEARMRGIVETAADGILTLSEAGRIETANPACERIFGYQLGELLEQPVGVLIPAWGEVVPASAFDLASRASPNAGLAEEGVGRRKDGTTFPLEYSLSAVRLGDRRVFTALVRDLSEKRRLEEQLRHAQKMHAIGQLAGGIAHDFNNLLTVINGYASLVQNMLGSNHPCHGSVEEILKAGNRAADLTGQLLAFSRKQMLQAKVLDLNRILSGLQPMLQRLIGEHIDIRLDLAANLPTMESDPGQVEQLIINLAVNARDAMPQGGQLLLATAQVDLTEEEIRGLPDLSCGPHVRLTVRDTGYGMDTATMERIFEPFFTTKEVGRGTGLGLATVYGIVKQSGGHITVASAPGQGTTFTLFFPALNRKAAPETVVQAMDLPTGSETVLLVEDEDGVRTFAQQVLQMSGYTVLEARHGIEALERLEQHPGPVHLLITDVVMPHMGGRALADVVRAQRPDIRVLFLSGYNDSILLRQGVEESAVALLPKPFQPATLAARVRAVLDRS